MLPSSKCRQTALRSLKKKNVLLGLSEQASARGCVDAFASQEEVRQGERSGNGHPCHCPVLPSTAPPTSSDNNKGKFLPKGSKHVSLNTVAEVTLCLPGQAHSWGRPRYRADLAALLPSKHAERSLSSADNKVMMFVVMLEKQNSPCAVTSPGSAEPKPLLPVGARPQLQVSDERAQESS